MNEEIIESVMDEGSCDRKTAIKAIRRSNGTLRDALYILEGWQLIEAEDNYLN